MIEGDGSCFWFVADLLILCSIFYPVSDWGQTLALAFYVFLCFPRGGLVLVLPFS